MTTLPDVEIQDLLRQVLTESDNVELLIHYFDQVQRFFSGNPDNCPKLPRNLGSLSLLQDRYTFNGKEVQGFNRFGYTFVKDTALKGEGCYLINHRNERCSDRGYDESRPFSEGRARVERNGFWWYVKLDGTDLSRERYSFVADFAEARARVSLGRLWWHIKLDGKDLSSERYDKVKDFSESRAVVKRDGRWWHIKLDGKDLSSERYDDVQCFSEGRAAVKRDDLWWLIKLDGSELSSERYDNATFFYQGSAPVERNGQHWLINLDGTDQTSRFDKDSDF